MIAKEHDEYKLRQRGLVVEMACVLLCVDYSRLFWLLFGVFIYENHEGKPRIF